MKPETIHIVSVCDNRYAILLGALIKSIALNHKEKQLIKYYVVDDGIGQKNKAKLLACVEGSSISLQWVAFNDAIPSKKDLPSDNSSFPLNVYLRLMIPSFLPKEASRAIYLDVDMVLEKDISNLWQIDLHGKPLGAVVDRCEVVSSEWGGIKNYQELGIRKEARYFNSGLLVMDLDLWRKSGYGSEVMRVVDQNKEFAFFPDQYGLNVVFADNWLELDKRWNSFILYDIDDPYLIHFISIKPIFSNYNGVEKYKVRFYHYLKQTPWKNFKPYGKWKWFYHKLLNKYFGR